MTDWMEAGVRLHRQRIAGTPMEVREDDRLRWLITEDAAIQSAIVKARPWHPALAYARTILTSLLWVRPERVLLLGLGGGGLVLTLRHVLPETVIDAVELHPEMVNLARTWFALPEPDARFHIHVGDALNFMADADARYDLVLLDVFNGMTVPPAFMTAEAIAACRKLLTSRGILAMNWVPADAQQFLDTGGAFRASFHKQVLFLPVEAHRNVVIFASKQPWSAWSRQDLRRGCEALEPRTGIAYSQHLARLCQTHQNDPGIQHWFD